MFWSMTDSIFKLFGSNLRDKNEIETIIALIYILNPTLVTITQSYEWDTIADIVI